MFSSISRVFVWIIMGMVLIGLVGFGSFNFGGSATAIGKVGDQEIDANAYFRELNAEMRAYENATGQNITIATAQALGLDAQVLARVIAAAALDNETQKLGLSVGDRNLADQITEIDAFKNPAGQFDRDTYDFVLQQSGLNTAEFEESLRADVARTFLSTAVTDGLALPAAFTDTLYAYARETRDFTWAEVTASALEAPLPDPSDDEVTAFYEANPAAFTAPEERQITYAWLTLEDVIATIPADEDSLRATYEDRLDEFQTPERRLVERLVFGSEDEAQAAYDRITAGETSFDDEVLARGLTLADADLGEVTQADLGPEGALIFAMERPGLAGPIATNLGPALMRMNAVLAARETSYEEARDELAAEAAQDAAIRLLRNRAAEVDELLAGGATLEELASDEGMPVKEIAYFQGLEEGIAAYPEFREAALAAAEGDYPEVVELEDGSFFALRLEGITPATLKPLDEVRDAAAQGARALALTAALNARAQAMVAEFDAGESPASLGLTEVVEEGISRNGFIAGAPETMVEIAFKVAKDDWQVIESVTGQIVVLRVDAITQPDQNSEEAVAVKTDYAARASQTLALDVQNAFAGALETQAGVVLDQAMINAVHTNFP